MRKCRRCHLVYAAAAGDPTAIYTDDYLTGRTEFGIDTTDPIVAAIGRLAANRRFEIIERMRGVGTVLDIGCGTGEALAVASERGWSGIGVEPVAASAARARTLGMDVRTNTLDASGLPLASFDVVVAAHVLEHMLDPVPFLRNMVSYARRGGLVVIEVPNWHHRQRRLQGRQWEHLRPLEHVMHFSPRTLGATMRRAGLRARCQTVSVVERRRIADRLGRGFAIVGIATV